jgi:amphi-Trp domain-containing protein
MDFEKTLTRSELIAVLDKLRTIVEQGSGDGVIQIDDLTVNIANDFTCELEYEEEGDQVELELELSWSKSRAKGTEPEVATVDSEPNSEALGSYQLFRGKDDQWYFHLKAANGRIILASEGYHHKQGAEKGIESVMENARESQFEMRMSKSKQPYFVLKAKNGQIIGVSQMYRRVSGCKKGIRSVITHGQAPTIEK